MARGCTVPFRINKKAPLILIKGTINGQGPINLVIDTGASLTVISPAVAAIAGVKPSRKKAKAVGANGAEKTKIVRLRSIEIGGIRVANLEAAVMDLSALNHAAHMHVEGILGFNFLKRYQITINYVNRQIRFAPVSSPKQRG